MADQLQQVAPGGIVQLNDSPGALDDATFDSLFPAESSTPRVAQQPTQQGTQAAPPAATQTTQTNEAYLKGDRSVYRTAEAAIEGINQKDALIEQLRTRYALTTGIDPITGQAVGAAQQHVELDYAQNPQQYLTDLYEASKKGPQDYASVQQKFIMDTLKPVQPFVQNSVRQQAIATVSKDNPEISKFLESPAYQATLDANEDLKNAITSAETDSRFYSRLPNLMKLAHLAGQGMQVPELLKAKAAQTQNLPPAQVRTTTQQTTPAPAQRTTQPNMKSIDGIRAIIANAEANGAKLEF